MFIRMKSRGFISLTVMNMANYGGEEKKWGKSHISEEKNVGQNYIK